MDTLKHDWLTDGLIDFEYKKYVLLAYLQDVKNKFDATELYPFLSDLLFHYRNLQKVKENKQLMKDQFPKNMTKADFEKLSFSYQLLVNDDDVMSEIEAIISFAIPKLTDLIDHGKELHEFVEENLEFSPIGLSSIYEREGYLFLKSEPSRDVNIYRYEMKLFDNAGDQYRAIATTLIGNETWGISHSFENMKVGLVRKRWDLPNPAAFLVRSHFKFPEISTLLPIAKRLLIKHISVA